MNQTQLVRSAINLFIVVAVGIALFQQLMNANQKPAQPPTVTTPTGQTVPVQPTGPIIPGFKIQATDNLHAPVKQLLAKNKINIEITSYAFQGNEYIFNLVLNWGHIVMIFFFMQKHKTETDDTKKRNIMIIGAIAVIGWFYVSAQMRPQRVAIQVHGSKVYEKDYLNDKEVMDVLNEYEFEIDDMNAAQAGAVPGTEKIDAWEQQQQQKKAQQAPKANIPIEDELQAEQIF